MAVGAGGRSPGPWSGALLLLLGVYFVPGVPGLEVSVGKNNQVTAKNGTDVLLPCTFATCIGFENAEFRWTFNTSDKFDTLYSGTIKDKLSRPLMKEHLNQQIELAKGIVGSTVKDYNISIILKDVDFSNAGKYTCFVMNPKEKGAKHNATLILTVVDKFVIVDNTLTMIIVSAVGGLIGLLILIFIMKKIITFAIKKSREKK